MGNIINQAKSKLRAYRTTISYQCMVCTADAESASSIQLDKDPTRSLSSIGQVVTTSNNVTMNKYF